MKNHNLSIDNYFFIYWSDLIKKEPDRLLLSVTFNPSKMSFMKDHFFNGKCLIPAAIFCDLLIQSAYYFNHNHFFPYYFDIIHLFRATHVNMHAKETLRIKLSRGNKDLYQADLVGERKNAQGHIVRKNVLIGTSTFYTNYACADFSFQNNTMDLIEVRINRHEYYENFVRTHGALFQTFTGNFKLTQNLQYLEAELFIGTQERHFSIKKGLCFTLSPLGLDSIFQAGVFMSILAPSSESEETYAKLPVSVKGMHLIRQFKQNGHYCCALNMLYNSDDLLTVQACVKDEKNTICCLIDQITFQRAPLLKFKKSKIQQVIHKYRKKMSQPGDAR